MLFLIMTSFERFTWNVFEDMTFLFNQKKHYTLLNDLPDPIVLGNKFYETSYDVSIWICL